MRDTEPNLPWEATRRGIAETMAEIDGALPGSVVVRNMHCGKGGCACKAEPPALHALTSSGPAPWTARPSPIPQRGPARPISTVVRQRPTPKGAHRDAPHRIRARSRKTRRLEHPAAREMNRPAATPSAQGLRRKAPADLIRHTHTRRSRAAAPQ